MKEKVFILYIGMILLVGGCYDDKGNYDYTDIGAPKDFANKLSLCVSSFRHRSNSVSPDSVSFSM